MRELPVVGEDDQDAVDAREGYERAKQKSFENVVSVGEVVAKEDDEGEEVCHDVEVEPEEERLGTAQENRHLFCCVENKCWTIWNKIKRGSEFQEFINFRTITVGRFGKKCYNLKEV